MSNTGLITDAYIDNVIKTAGIVNPDQDKTLGTEMRELVKLLRDRIAQEITEIPGPYISQTYAQLGTLMAANTLIIGQQYLLSDYNTQYIQPVTNAVKTDSPFERLILTACSPNSFSSQANSLDFPDDQIEYDYFNNVLVPGQPAVEGTYGANFMQSEIVPGAVNVFVGLLDSNGNLFTGDIPIESNGIAGDSYSWNILKNSSPVQVIVFTTDANYTGSGFNLLINGAVFPVTPGQIIADNGNPLVNHSVITVVAGNVELQAYNTNQPAYIPLPDNSADTPSTPDTLRNGWISRRIDDSLNDASFDHRNIFTWGEVTPAWQGYTLMQIDVTPPASGTNDYSEAKIYIGHYLQNSFAIYDQYPNGNAFEFYSEFYLDGNMNVYAIGKCTVESYCLINGVQYTIPPFDNKEADMDLTDDNALIPIASFSSGNIYVQVFPEANNVPAYTPLPDMSAGAEAILGEKKVFGSNCSKNYIERFQNGNLPQIIMGDNCSNNRCLAGSNNIYLTNYCTDNLFIESGVSCLANSDGSTLSINNEVYNYSAVRVQSGNNNIIFTSNVSFLYGNTNNLSNSNDSAIIGDNNTLLDAWGAYINGSNNYNGQNISEGVSTSFINGNSNISPGFINRRFIRGSGNIFTNVNSIYLRILYVIGNSNNIYGDSGFNIFGDENIIFYTNAAESGGTINGNANYLNSRCFLIETGKGFNYNRLENVQNSSYGNNCENNYESGVSNVNRGDNYSEHKPWLS